MKECNEGKNKYTIHNPASIGFYLKCAYDDSLSFYQSYRGPNPAKWFINKLDAIYEDSRERLQPFPFYTISEEEEKAFQDAEICHICSKGGFNKFDITIRKVRDHDHRTGKYRGPTHS